MRVRNAMIVALVASMPVMAFAQEGEDDEFYRDPDILEQGPSSNVIEPELEVGASLDVREEEQLPFRGTAFIYENIVSAAAPAVDLSPAASFYYAMSYSFRPRYYFRDWFSLRLRLDLEQELTDSSSTTQHHEPVLSDLWLDFYFSDLVSSYSETVDIDAYVRLAFPSSKLSRARSLVMGGTIGGRFAYTAPVLAGLRLSYGLGVTKYFNQYSTAVQDAPTTTCTPGSAINCDTQLNLGGRNPSVLLRNVLGLDFMPTENLSISFNVLFYNYFLYSVADATTEDLGVDIRCTDPAGCDITSDPNNTDKRASIWYLIEIGYQVTPWLGLAIGTSTFNPQLTPSSEYRAPFFNRFTNIYFDMNLTFDALVQAIRGRRSQSVASRHADEV